MRKQVTIYSISRENSSFLTHEPLPRIKFKNKRGFKDNGMSEHNVLCPLGLSENPVSRLVGRTFPS
jgi:hypothetical protein